MKYRVKWIKDVYGDSKCPVANKLYIELERYLKFCSDINEAYRHKQKAELTWPKAELIVEEIQ